MNRILTQYLDDMGDGSGTKNANGNYSVTSDIFFIQPPAETQYLVKQVIVVIEDTTGMATNEYGNIGAALTNGVTLRIQDDNGVVATIADQIKTNLEWMTLTNNFNFVTMTNDVLHMVIDLGQTIILKGDLRLEVFLNDDLTGLVSHFFVAQGEVRRLYA